MPDAAESHCESGGKSEGFLQPWQSLLLVLVGWINLQQQGVIEYLLGENLILRQIIVKKRIRLARQQRRRLAIKGKILGRKMIERIAGIASLETIILGQRGLVAQN